MNTAGRHFPSLDYNFCVLSGRCLGATTNLVWVRGLLGKGRPAPKSSCQDFQIIMSNIENLHWLPPGTHGGKYQNCPSHNISDSELKKCGRANFGRKDRSKEKIPARLIDVRSCEKMNIQRIVQVIAQISVWWGFPQVSTNFWRIFVGL